MKKKTTNANLIKSQVIPLFIVVMIFVFMLFFMLIGEKKMMNTYLVSSKTREACVLSASVYNDIARLNAYDDIEQMQNIYETYNEDNDNFLGINIQNNNDTLIWGEKMPENKLSLDSFLIRSMSFIDLTNPIYISEEGNNGIYKGLMSDFDYIYAMEPIRDNPRAEMFVPNERRVNKVVGQQDYWIEFSDADGSLVYVGYSVPLTDNDYMLCYIFDTGYKLTRILIIIVMVIFVLRIFHSQKKLVATYFTDNETLGKNWYYFLEYTDKALRHIRKNGRYSMYSIKLNNFHSYCSCYGAAAGQELLKNIYNALGHTLPKKTLFARHDGAEFGIFIKDISKEESEELAHKILDALNNIQKNTAFHYSIGIYNHLENDDLDASAAHTLSYIASTHAKKDNNIAFFTKEMKENLNWEKKMELDFHNAIQNREFKIYLQPKVSVNSRKYAAAEALVRWEHPTEGFLTPNRFIPVFEENGLISELDNYMISEVARIIAERLEQGKPVVPISVNVSRVHFIDNNLAKKICELVDNYKVPHEYIELELTESAFFDDKDLIINTSNQLREFGFSVSLDDFGSGYSSLNSLRELPIDIVKLDGGFFRGKELDAKGKIIVSEIITLAKQLNIQIVAEGIENESEVDFLEKLNCDLIQGFYFAKPMPHEEMEELLDK